MGQSVMIDKKLFDKSFAIIARLAFDLDLTEYAEDIAQAFTGFCEKLDALQRRSAFAQYKQAESEDAREAARREYLRQAGIPQEFISQREARNNPP